MATTKLVISAMYSGQGMCNVIEAYDGGTVTKLMLADFGAEKDSATARLYTLATLKKKVIARGKIDVMVISHSDRDHWNLMGELLDSLPSTIKIDIAAWGIGNWLNAAKTFRDKVEGRLLSFASKKYFWTAETDIKNDGANIDYWDVGWGEVKFQVLAASVTLWTVNKNYNIFLTEPNTASIVLKCDFAAKFSVMTGDATWATLKFINDKMGDYTFADTGFMVTAPHHGAIATLQYKLDELAKFIGMCEQQCSLASAQLRSGFNHPNVCVMCTMAEFGGASTFGTHSAVLNFPRGGDGHGICDTNAIFKTINALTKEDARTGYDWYRIKLDQNIFTTLLTGSAATDWMFTTNADGSTEVTRNILAMDFARGVIEPTALVDPGEDEDNFYVGRPPAQLVAFSTEPDIERMPSPDGEPTP
jgi:beta-lactamase superfamily II metal-dependent hydrolase